MKRSVLAIIFAVIALVFSLLTAEMKEYNNVFFTLMLLSICVSYLIKR